MFISDVTIESIDDEPYPNSLTPTKLFPSTFPPLSPILPYNETSVHNTNNHDHTVDDLPQNTTIMNDTCISHNFYKF